MQQLQHTLQPSSRLPGMSPRVSSPRVSSGGRRPRLGRSPRSSSAGGAATAALGGPANFASSHEGPFSVAVLGDLHLEPAQMHLFHEARDQLAAAMSGGERGAPLPGARVVQLGDLGGYQHQPGSRACFTTAAEYLSNFGVPFGVILGNHDLEGAEFEDDPSNLAAWREAFGQRHFWAEQLGPLLLVGLSTVRFRSNKHSVHEVFIDDEQLRWFEALLEQHRAAGTPIAVFTHAPPMGSGLKVVENVHVKNRCAWLNHSAESSRTFIRLVEANPNVKLWFSGHFHLSQNYLDSISVVGSCAFVQTGVIGECNRDGNRQSRLLRFTSSGYELFTVDHSAGGRLRLDLAHGWSSRAAPSPVTPEHELIPDARAGWLRSHLDCSLEEAGGGAGAVRWLPAGPNCLLAVQEGIVVEYDMEMRSPIGIVAFLEGGEEVSLVAADGSAPAAADGSDAAAVLLRDPATGELRSRLERNEAGGFFRVFQANKWVAAKLKAAQEAAAAAAAAASGQQEVLVSASS